MPRPKKTGLDYYYKDVHEMDDFRVMDLMERYGAAGYVVMDMTVSSVYRSGYYLELPVERLAAYIYRYIAGTCHQTRQEIAEIIRYCGELGIFDSRLLANSVITSREIQEHYASVTARNKVDKTKYWLLPKDDSDCQDQSETGVYATETGVYATETGINVAEMQQRKENKSKANQSTANKINVNQSTAEQSQSKANQSTANKINANQSTAEQSQSTAEQSQSTANQSTANKINANQSTAEQSQSRAKQSKHRSADEIFCGAEFADADADADAGYNAGNTAMAAAAKKRKAYADDDDDDETYADIENAYLAASGKRLSDVDRADIDKIRQEGADDSLILYAMKRVSFRRNQQKIHSFRYYMPMIRDLLSESYPTSYSPTPKKPQQNDGFIRNGATIQELYPDCATDEEIIRTMEREWGHEPGWFDAPYDDSYDD